MAIKGIGTDIIEIARIAKSIERQGQPFLDRVFTEREQSYCQSFQEAERHYAGRFAAKEAVSKAWGTGIGQSLSWVDIEIVNEASGRPTVYLSEASRALFGDAQIHLSISHCKEYATAMAVIED